MSADITSPPRHAVILCHPEKGSFNASVAEAYCSAVSALGHETCVRDLYAMNFQPALRASEQPGAMFHPHPDVEEEIRLLHGADVFVLVYPIWFGLPPAMLKGYVERVFGRGVMPRDLQERSARGVLAGKRLVSFTSSGTSAVWLDEQGQIQSLRTIFDRYLEHAFGMAPSEHFHFGHIVEGLNTRFVEQDLTDVRDYARAIARKAEQAA
ncbi:NAD(P)H-dependent oxidoreductase [Sphingomonas sp. NPDC079357]|uniref:NAD(P)H-dependent oxidoreductase n=1 Tax=Sphingomonas sp. NPDC079357 TaxID=3364518 RepID=UPI00384F7B3D